MLKAEIVGQVNVAPGSSFSVNAVRQRTSDWNATEAISYLWSCIGNEVALSAGCGALKLGDSSVHLVPGGVLDPGQYTFTVHVSQRDREAYASLAVVINATPIGGAITAHCIGVACAYPDRSVNPRQALELQVTPPSGVSTEESEVQWAWLLTSFAIEDYLLGGVEGGWRVSVSTDGLQLANNHTFQATIIDKASKETMTTLERTVRVDEPPVCADPEGVCFQVGCHDE
jgi:hypothetical protein